MNFAKSSGWRIALAVGALLPVLAGPFATAADAATHHVRTIARHDSADQMISTVLHAAYLKSSARLGTYNEIGLVPAGTVLTVLASTAYWLHVKLPDGRIGYITANHYYTSAPQINQASVASMPSGVDAAANATSVARGSSNAAAPSATSVAGGSFANGSSVTTSLPPGVHLDPTLSPLASLTATNAQKFAAVLAVAQSKLGTPYIWGHNEDRGQYGFDCSNFVEYVYHHALGYLFSTSSRTQFYSVGTPVPLSQMQPGDLLFFSDNTNPTGTAHVGIYIGNGEMIQEGGGLGKVGYLSVTTGYWARHLVAAHRLF